MSLKKVIRKATNNDLSTIIAMLADDDLGKQREIISAASLVKYQRAFDAIEQDPNAELLVLQLGDNIIGTAQINYLAGLSYQGSTRAQIEAVRIAKNYRGQGLGEYLITEIIERAKVKNCHMVQLTTNKIRTRAKKFYEKLGFTASHEGMKLII